MISKLILTYMDPTKYDVLCMRDYERALSKHSSTQHEPKRLVVIIETSLMVLYPPSPSKHEHELQFIAFLHCPVKIEYPET